MKKKLTALVAFFIFLSSTKAQVLIGQFYSSTPSHQITETRIEGINIAGTPYLNNDWLDGSVQLEDGRKYDSYKFRYDIYNQVLSFFNGKDSLEVDEHITAFDLNDQNKGTLHFVNASTFGKKESKSIYYQVVYDDNRCIFLRLYKKVIESSDQSLVKYRESKYLKTVFENYIYNKATKKLATFNKADENLKSMFSFATSDSK